MCCLYSVWCVSVLCIVCVPLSPQPAGRSKNTTAKSEVFTSSQWCGWRLLALCSRAAARYICQVFNCWHNLSLDLSPRHQADNHLNMKTPSYPTSHLPGWDQHTTMTLIRFTLEGPIVKSHWNTYVTISTTSFHISSAENSSKKPKPAYVDISTGLSHWGLYLSKSRWERGGGVGPGKWREVKKRVTKRKLFIPCQKKRQKLFNFVQDRAWAE